MIACGCRDHGVFPTSESCSLTPSGDPTFQVFRLVLQRGLRMSRRDEVELDAEVKFLFVIFGCLWKGLVYFTFWSPAWNTVVGLELFWVFCC